MKNKQSPPDPTALAFVTELRALITAALAGKGIPAVTIGRLLIGCAVVVAVGERIGKRNWLAFCADAWEVEAPDVKQIRDAIARGRS